MVFFLIIGILLIILVTFSKIRIEIQNLIFSTENKERFNNDYEIKIKLKILSKITIAKI